MKLIHHKNLDKVKWNALMEKSGNIYSLSWYMDSIAENWMVAISDDEKNFVLLPYKSKLGVKIIYQPFFTREIAFNLGSKYSFENIFSLLDHKFKNIEFGLDNLNKIDTNKFQIEERKHQILNLNDSYENIQKKYSENAKRLIKKAEKQNLKLILHNDVSPVVNLFRDGKGKELKELGDKEFELLRKLMKAGLKNGVGKCYHVVNEKKEIVAAGYFFDWNGQLIYLKGAANEYGKKMGAMYIMFDTIIHQNAKKRQILDFGGSRIQSVANFYQKFGAQDRKYYFIKHQNLPIFYKVLKAASKLVKR